MAKAGCNTRSTCGWSASHVATSIPVISACRKRSSRVPDNLSETDDVTDLKAKFEDAYRALFGRTIDDLAVEITNWSVTVSSIMPPISPVTSRYSGADQTGGKDRSFFDAALRKTVIAREVERRSLTAGDTVQGPAVIVENETTTIVTSGFRAVAQDDGSLLIIRKDVAEARS